MKKIRWSVEKYEPVRPACDGCDRITEIVVVLEEAADDKGFVAQLCVRCAAQIRDLLNTALTKSARK